MYFLVVGCLQLDVFFPGLSPTHWSTTIGPLAFVLSINAVKEMYDDYFRHRSDAVVNSSLVEVIRGGAGDASAATPRLPGSATSRSSSRSSSASSSASSSSSTMTRWRDLAVGDVVRVRGNCEFPADILMLQSSDPQGLAHVETANLDGETNLKVKTCVAAGLPFGGEPASPDELRRALRHTRVECEPPNNQLYTFEGKWVGLRSERDETAAETDAEAESDAPLRADNLLLRGSTLRNADWILGVVVFTGADSKLMRNMTRAPHKVSQLERHMNVLVVSVGAFQIAVGGALAAAQARWYATDDGFRRPSDPGADSDFGAGRHHWYLRATGTWPDVEGGFGAAATQFVRFVVLLNALIPISLYVTLELVKVMQCGWISLDRELRDDDAGVSCGVRTTTLNEELGHVRCVLSDKTGTLTRNVMAFVKCSVGGTVYRGDDDDEEERAVDADRSTDGSTDGSSSHDRGITTLRVTIHDADRATKKGAFSEEGAFSEGSFPGGASASAETHSLCRSSRLRAARDRGDPRVEAFLSHLAACHTVTPAEDVERRGGGVAGLLYQAASPDEEALVTGAALLGRRLVRNAAGVIAVRREAKAETKKEAEAVPFDGKTQTETGTESGTVIDARGETEDRYEVLAVNEFSSARKRMSVVVRLPPSEGGGLRLLLKGADAAVLARIAVRDDVGDEDEVGRSDDDEDEETARLAASTDRPRPRPRPRTTTSASEVRAVREHLDAFAREGLRTLVLARRDLTESEFSAWHATYRAASTALVDREDRLAAAAEAIERDCELVGATAVEDKLQEGVPETIATLREAGVLVWMLTGDKLETAVSIANTCKLVDADGDLVVVRESDVVGDGADGRFLERKAREAAEDRALGSEFGLVIEGGALQHALREDQQGHFLDLCASCTGVVCCRVSPIQKARVTSLMKERGGRVTLGVGDGANDVGMIKAAHIGVGISGREGRAAVLASDFSVGQFRFLARLLLVHGRWSAKRNREVVLYAFYKNFTYTMANVWFGFLSAYSAQPIYTTAAIATFNVLWTSLPTVAFACFDQDVVASVALAHPRLYEETAGFDGADFARAAAWWLASASWHSLWCFFVAVVALGDPAAATAEGKPWDLWSAGVAAFSSVVVACNLKVAARTNHWTAFNAAAVLVSVALWFPFLVLLGNAWRRFGAFASVHDVHAALLPQPAFWLSLALGAGGAVVADLFFERLRALYRPEDHEILREAEMAAAAAAAAAAARRAKPGERKVRGGDGRGFTLASALSSFSRGRKGATLPTRRECKGRDKTRRKSRNPSVVEVVREHRNFSDDWHP